MLATKGSPITGEHGEIINFREAQFRILGGVADVAAQGQFQSATEAKAMQGRDYRPFEVFNHLGYGMTAHEPTFGRRRSQLRK